MKKLLASLVMLLALSIPAMASAAPTPVQVTGTIEIDQQDLNFGDYATFTVTHSKLGNHQDLRVWVRCYQGDVWVWQQVDGPDSFFVMGNGSGAWFGGAADCTADLLLTTYSHHKIVDSEPIDQTSWFVGA